MLPSVTAVFSRSILILTFALFCAGCATTPRPPEPAAPAAQLLRKAERERSDAQAIGLYLDAAYSALQLASDRSATPAVRAAGQEIYNTALAECVVALKKDGLLPTGGGVATFPGARTTYRLKVAKAEGSTVRDPAEFQKFVEASKVYRKHLHENNVRSGLGGALVGVIETKETVPNRPLGGFALPITAVAGFGPNRSGETPVDLTFYNPQMKEKVTVDGATFSLKGDFTAPLAYFPRKREMLFGIVAMVFSDRIAERRGIYFLEPFDPDKIPVIFIHGLMSSPHAWVNFVNTLDANPEFRKSYQPWVLFYPSGGPIAGNALRLREELADIAKNYPLKRNIVLVGHSMGGILSQMQVTNSKRLLWDSIFRGHADGAYRKLPEDGLLKRALVFKANPYITRVIFIATPHRGSQLADMRISALAARFIRMPTQLVKAFDPQMRNTLREIDPKLRTIPTSIIGLSPRNPLLKGVDKLEIVVPYHSIIGNQGKDQLPLKDSSDSIVPYWSSHMDGAQSEIIVPTGHDAFDHPKSTAEVLRILAVKK